MKEFLIRIVSTFLGKGTQEAKQATEEVTKATQDYTQAQKENEQSTQALSTRTGILAGAVAALATKAIDMAVSALRSLKRIVLESIVSFADLEASTVSLGQSLTNMGEAGGSTLIELQRLAKSLSRSTATPERTWIGIFQRLIQQGVSSGDIPRYAKSIEQLAGLIGGDITAASSLFSQAMGGNYISLRQYGIAITDASDKSGSLREIMSQLAEKGAGVLAAQNTTLAGGIAELSQAWNELKNVTGQWLAGSGAVQNFVRGLVSDFRLLSDSLDSSEYAYRRLAQEQASAERQARVYAEVMERLSSYHYNDKAAIEGLRTAYSLLTPTRKEDTSGTLEAVEAQKKLINEHIALTEAISNENRAREVAKGYEDIIQAETAGLESLTEKIQIQREQDKATEKQQFIRDMREKKELTAEEFQKLVQYSNELESKAKAYSDLMAHATAEDMKSRITTEEKVALVADKMRMRRGDGEQELLEAKLSAQQALWRSEAFQSKRQLKDIEDIIAKNREKIDVEREGIQESTEELAKAKGAYDELEKYRDKAKEVAEIRADITSISEKEISTLEDAHSVRNSINTLLDKELEISKDILDEKDRKAIQDGIELTRKEKLAELQEVINRLEKDRTAQQRAVALDNQRLRVLQLRGQGLDDEAKKEEQAIRRAELVARYAREHGEEAEKYVDLLMAAQDAVEAREQAEKGVTGEMGKQRAEIDKQLDVMGELERQAKARGAKSRVDTYQDVGGQAHKRLFVGGRVVYDTARGLNDMAARHAGLDTSVLPDSAKPSAPSSPPTPTPAPSSPGSSATEAVLTGGQKISETIVDLTKVVGEASKDNVESINALATALLDYFNDNARAHSDLKSMIAAQRN